MIAKTSKGYVVKSESGKVLSKPYATRKQAEKRLNEIEYHKSKKWGRFNSLLYFIWDLNNLMYLF